MPQSQSESSYLHTNVLTSSICANIVLTPFCCCCCFKYTLGLSVQNNDPQPWVAKLWPVFMHHHCWCKAEVRNNTPARPDGGSKPRYFLLWQWDTGGHQGHCKTRQVSKFCWLVVYLPLWKKKKIQTTNHFESILGSRNLQFCNQPTRTVQIIQCFTTLKQHQFRPRDVPYILMWSISSQSFHTHNICYHLISHHILFHKRSYTIKKTIVPQLFWSSPHVSFENTSVANHGYPRFGLGRRVVVSVVLQRHLGLNALPLLHPSHRAVALDLQHGLCAQGLNRQTQGRRWKDMVTYWWLVVSTDP